MNYRRLANVAPVYVPVVQFVSVSVSGRQLSWCLFESCLNVLKVQGLCLCCCVVQNWYKFAMIKMSGEVMYY